MIINIFIYIFLGFFLISYFSIIGFTSSYIKKSSLKSFIEIPTQGMITSALVLSLLLFAGIPFKYGTIILLALTIAGLIFISIRKDIDYFKLTFELAQKFIKDYIYLFLGIFICSGILIFSKDGNSVFDPWGSGDYFFYWSNSDYFFLQNLSKEYLSKKSLFPVENLKEHIISPPWIRWGAFGLISQFKLFSSNFNVLFMNPIISLCIFLSIILVASAIKTDIIKNPIISLAISLIAFNYFSLYYTYLSQVIAVSFLLYYIYLNSLDSASYSVKKSIALAALFYTHEILTSLVVFVVLSELILIFIKKDKNTHFLNKYFWISSILLIAPVSLKVINSVLYAANKRPLVGWEWERLPFISDFFGITSPLIYQLGKVGKMSYEFGFITSLILIALVLYLFRKSKHYHYLSLGLANILLALIAYKFVLTGTRNGSHAIWKMFSLFPFFFQVMYFDRIYSYLQKNTPKALNAFFVLVVALPAFGFFTQNFTPPWFSFEMKVALDRTESDQYFIFPDFKRSPYIHSLIALFNNKNVYSRSFINVAKQVSISKFCSQQSTYLLPTNKALHWNVREQFGNFVSALPPVDFQSSRKNYQPNATAYSVLSEGTRPSYKALNFMLSRVKDKSSIVIKFNKSIQASKVLINGVQGFSSTLDSQTLQISASPQQLNKCQEHSVIQIVGNNTTSYPEVLSISWR